MASGTLRAVRAISMSRAKLAGAKEHPKTQHTRKRRQQNFSPIKFALSKFYCRGVSHAKQRFGRFSSLPPRPPPPQKRKFYFYCRLAVSDTPQNADIRRIPESAFSGVLRFRVCFGALLEGNKEHPKTQHTRKRRFWEQSITCVFGCVAFSGALCSPLTKNSLPIVPRQFLSVSYPL